MARQGRWPICPLDFAGDGHYCGVMAGLWLVAGVSRSGVDAGLASAWAATAFQAVREVGGRVEGRVQLPGPGRNYYRLPVFLPRDGRVLLLLNAGIRLVACQVARSPGELVLPFCDVPRGDLFELAGFVVAESEQLEQALLASHVRGLDRDEIRDIEHHKPPRVGDVIYNWFD
jgi:hypothetical protein